MLLQSCVRSLEPRRLGCEESCLLRKGSRWQGRVVRIRPCCFVCIIKSPSRASMSSPGRGQFCFRAMWGRAAQVLPTLPKCSQRSLQPGSSRAALLSGTRIAGGLGCAVHCSRGVPGTLVSFMVVGWRGGVRPAAPLLSPLHRFWDWPPVCQPLTGARTTAKPQIKAFFCAVQNR